MMYLDKEKYDIIPTYDPNEAKDYDGFIGRDGAFYKVSKKYKHKPTHEDWAEWYLDETGIYFEDFNRSIKNAFELGKYAEKQAILIHRYGYVYYGHSELEERRVCYVYPRDKESNISYQQKEMLEAVMTLNGEYNELASNTLKCSYANREYLDRFRKDKLGAKMFNTNIKRKKLGGKK